MRGLSFGKIILTGCILSAEALETQPIHREADASCLKSSILDKPTDKGNAYSMRTLLGRFCNLS